jgi:hypothetical protein
LHIASHWGTDGNMHFGASSGDTYISYYDRQADSIIKYPAIYPPNSYVMMIAGDTDFIYSVTGQAGYQLWAQRKSDDSTKMIFSVPSSGNIALGNLREGAMANTNYFTGKNIAWWLHGFDTVRGVYGSGHRLEVIEFYNYKNNVAAWVTSYYDAGTATYSYQTSTGLDGSIQLTSANSPSAIRFGWSINDSTIGFIGDNYGSTYNYNLNADISTSLGATGYNAYSVLKYNDSLIFYGAYPNGAMLKHNINQAWTLGKYNPATGQAIPLSKTSNPAKASLFRSENATRQSLYL